MTGYHNFAGYPPKNGTGWIAGLWDFPSLTFITTIETTFGPTDLWAVIFLDRVEVYTVHWSSHVLDTEGEAVEDCIGNRGQDRMVDKDLVLPTWAYLDAHPEIEMAILLRGDQHAHVP